MLPVLILAWVKAGKVVSFLLRLERTTMHMHSRVKRGKPMASALVNADQTKLKNRTLFHNGIRHFNFG